MQAPTTPLPAQPQGVTPWPAHPAWQRLVADVNRLGLETGREFAAALDPEGLRVGPIAAGSRHTVVIADEARQRLRQADAKLAICHNHPAHPGDMPGELSPSDLALLGCPGVRSVHMVSSYEPEAYSIASRTLDLDTGAWMAAIRLARDIAWDLAVGEDACRYFAAHGVEHLDHQRVFVRVLDAVGLIDWTARFDGATADFERRHGAFLDGLAENGAERFVQRLAGVCGEWTETTGFLCGRDAL